MRRITQEEAIELLTRFANSELFAEADKLMDIGECINCERLLGKSMWGEDAEETKYWYEEIEEED